MRLRVPTTAKIFAVSISVLVLCCSCSHKAQISTERHVKSFEGKPPICPRWAFEPWVWEDVDNTQKSTTTLVEGYISHNIPVGAVIVDSPWETEYNTLEWDQNRYPQPEQMILGFKSKGVRTILWITGYVDVNTPDFEFVKANGYGVDGGKLFEWWKGKGIHLDFTNPEAVKWWQGKMDKMLTMGAAGWKVDVGEQHLGQQVQTYVGSISKQTFKGYYYGTMIDGSLARNPEAVIIARPWSWQDGFGAPVSKCTIGWSGDFTGNWDGLKHQLYNLYRSARAGYGVLGVEVGGYMIVNPNRKQLIRYEQFGAMMPVMNNGGANGGLTNHLPWWQDQQMGGHEHQTVDIYRYWATLHSELGDYLFSSSVDAHLYGTPVVRDANDAKFQHRLGDSIFVSVMTNDANEKEVAFPRDGYWIDLQDQHEAYKGGTTINYSAPLSQYPVFVKAGAIIPMNVKSGVTGFGDKTSAGKQTIVIFPAGESKMTYHKSLGDGVEYSDVRISVNENTGTVSIEGSRKADYRLRIKAFEPPAGVSGADKWYYDRQGRFIIINVSAEKATITIERLRSYSTRQS